MNHILPRQAKRFVYHPIIRTRYDLDSTLVSPKALSESKPDSILGTICQAYPHGAGLTDKVLPRGGNGGGNAIER